ncbi:hypothetical protein [Xenorhabdus szentirmaii]|nr:hypothetical protein [Xenorhabdus sp. 5]
MFCLNALSYPGECQGFCAGSFDRSGNHFRRHTVKVLNGYGLEW